MILHPDGRIEGTVEECTAYKLHQQSHSKPFKGGLAGLGDSLDIINQARQQMLATSRIPGDPHVSHDY